MRAALKHQPKQQSQSIATEVACMFDGGESHKSCKSFAHRVRSYTSTTDRREFNDKY
jgi:hypothetical protein